MISITKNFLTNRRNRPALRDPEFYRIKKLKGVVMHWTANEGTGANAINNRQYFETTTRHASAHYIVDDSTILQCLPDHEVGYHVGGRYYQPMGKAIMEGTDLTPNYYLIGIEMCVNKDGDWQKTYQNSVQLAQHLLDKYQLTIKDLYRHYDITGKDCPKMMVAEDKWQTFRGKVNSGLKFGLGAPIKSGTVNTMDLNVRTGNGIEFPIVSKLNMGESVTIYEELGNWYRIGDNQWVHKHYVKITFTKKTGIVNDPTGLNIRIGPGIEFSIVDVLKDGEQVTIYNKKGNWYNIGVDRWAFHKLIDIVDIKTGRVNAPTFLNVRKGPGTEHPIVKKLQGDTLVQIYEEKDSWYRVGDNEWAFGFFIEIVDQTS